jgi:hypothetical protein
MVEYCATDTKVQVQLLYALTVAKALKGFWLYIIFFCLRKTEPGFTAYD